VPGINKIFMLQAFTWQQFLIVCLHPLSIALPTIILKKALPTLAGSRFIKLTQPTELIHL
jgi:hypothetical protein